MGGGGYIELEFPMEFPFLAEDSGKFIFFAGKESETNCSAEILPLE